MLKPHLEPLPERMEREKKVTPLVLTCPELSATPFQVLSLPCTTPICPWGHH